MNLYKDARLLKTDCTSSRRKPIINTVCLTTVSRGYDRDPDLFVAIVGLAVLSSSAVIALMFTSTVIPFPKTSDFSIPSNTKLHSQQSGGKGERGIQRDQSEREQFQGTLGEG